MRDDTYTISHQADPRWAQGVSAVLACRLARVAVRLGKAGVAVVRDRDLARMSLVPDGTGKGYKLLTPTEAARR